MFTVFEKYGGYPRTDFFMFQVRRIYEEIDRVVVDFEDYVTTLSNVK